MYQVNIKLVNGEKFNLKGENSTYTLHEVLAFVDEVRINNEDKNIDKITIKQVDFVG